MDYDEYLRFKADYAARREVYERLKHLHDTNKHLGITPEAWNEMDTNWQKVEAQVGQTIHNGLYNILRLPIFATPPCRRIMGLNKNRRQHFQICVREFLRQRLTITWEGETDINVFAPFQ
jgi:hypothetical protein